jgi:hypothetical protein
MSKRIRRIGSIKSELLKKSREAALAAVQIFNNPNISFKSESYVVLMIIAWTYLLHAYFRDKKIEYRYFQQNGCRRAFQKTKHGAYKYWELERCINSSISPVDKDTANNLRFMIGLRHEIEHQMTTRIDDMLSARFQACGLNYNEYIKKLFGTANGIERHLAFSLQFSTISTEQKEMLDEYPDLPKHILHYINIFDTGLSDDEFSSQRYAYRILFVQKTANNKGNADRVIEFVRSDSPLADTVNKEYAVIKEIEKRKHLPKQIVDLMKEDGYPNFSIYHHTQLWKSLDAKNPAKGYGTLVAGKVWHWYERWISIVREHCFNNKEKFHNMNNILLLIDKNEATQCRNQRSGLFSVHPERERVFLEALEKKFLVEGGGTVGFGIDQEDGPRQFVAPRPANGVQHQQAADMLALHGGGHGQPPQADGRYGRVRGILRAVASGRAVRRTDAAHRV